MNEVGPEEGDELTYGLSHSPAQAPPLRPCPPPLPTLSPALQTLLSGPSGASLSFSAACCNFRFRSWNMSWCRFRVCMIFCRGRGGGPEPGEGLPCPAPAQRRLLGTGLPVRAGSSSPAPPCLLEGLGPGNRDGAHQDPPRSPVPHSAISAAVGRRVRARSQAVPQIPQPTSSCLRMREARAPHPCPPLVLADTPLTTLKLSVSVPKHPVGQPCPETPGAQPGALEEEGG